MLWLKKFRHVELATYNLCKKEFNPYLGPSFLYINQASFKIPLPLRKALIGHLIQYGVILLFHSHSCRFMKKIALAPFHYPLSNSV